MKKLIGIFVILLITLNILGQGNGAYDPNVLMNPPVFMYKTFIDHFPAYIAGDRSSYKNFENQQRWFTANGTYYIVSYDTTSVDYTECSPNTSKTREVWLMKWDKGNWVRAMHKPLRIDSIHQSVDGIWSQCIYLPSPYNGGKIEQYGNGKILIVLPHVTVPDMRKPGQYFRGNDEVFNLEPSQDGNYRMLVKMQLI